MVTVAWCQLGQQACTFKGNLSSRQINTASNLKPTDRREILHQSKYWDDPTSPKQHHQHPNIWEESSNQRCQPDEHPSGPPAARQLTKRSFPRRPVTVAAETRHPAMPERRQRGHLLQSRDVRFENSGRSRTCSEGGKVHSQNK